VEFDVVELEAKLGDVNVYEADERAMADGPEVEDLHGDLPCGRPPVSGFRWAR
jgi:hypothetical protein